MLGRLKAVLTPQSALVFILLFLLFLAVDAYDTKKTGSLEERAENVLSLVEGAGNVSVVIQTRARNRENASLVYGRIGDGDEEIPYGAVAVSQGAADPIVRMRLTQALCALLGLPASAVSVVEGDGGE